MEEEADDHAWWKSPGSGPCSPPTDGTTVLDFSYLLHQSCRDDSTTSSAVGSPSGFLEDAACSSVGAAAAASAKELDQDDSYTAAAALEVYANMVSAAFADDEQEAAAAVDPSLSDSSACGGNVCNDNDDWFPIVDDDDASETPDQVCNSMEEFDAIKHVLATASTPAARASLVIRAIVEDSRRNPPSTTTTLVTSPQPEHMDHLPWNRPVRSEMRSQVCATVSAKSAYASYVYVPDPANPSRMKRIKSDPLVPAATVYERMTDMHKRKSGTRLWRNSQTAESQMEKSLPHLKSRIRKLRMYHCPVCKSTFIGLPPKRHARLCKDHRLVVSSAIKAAPARPLLKPGKRFVWKAMNFESKK